MPGQGHKGNMTSQKPDMIRGRSDLFCLLCLFCLRNFEVWFGCVMFSTEGNSLRLSAGYWHCPKVAKQQDYQAAIFQISIRLGLMTVLLHL